MPTDKFFNLATYAKLNESDVRKMGIELVGYLNQLKSLLDFTVTTGSDSIYESYYTFLFKENRVMVSFCRTNGVSVPVITAVGGSFYGDTSQSILYPSQFNTTPIIYPSPASPGFASGAVWPCVALQRSSTGSKFRFTSPISATATVNIQYIAIGTY